MLPDIQEEDEEAILAEEAEAEEVEKRRHEKEQQMIRGRSSSSIKNQPEPASGSAPRRAQSLNIDAYTGTADVETMRRHQSLQAKTVSTHSRNARLDTSSDSEGDEEPEKQPVRRRKSVSLLEEISSSE